MCFWSGHSKGAETSYACPTPMTHCSSTIFQCPKVLAFYAVPPTPTQVSGTDVWRCDCGLESILTHTAGIAAQHALESKLLYQDIDSRRSQVQLIYHPGHKFLVHIGKDAGPDRPYCMLLSHLSSGPFQMPSGSCIALLYLTSPAVFNTPSKLLCYFYFPVLLVNFTSSEVPGPS